MALPFYMTVEGETQGPIEGFSTTTGHETQIQCHALKQTIAIPINKQTGQPSGLRNHGPITITKSFDKASPLLYQAMVNGERMKEVVLRFYRITKAGLEENYYTITLTNATLVSISPIMYNVFDDDLQRYDHMEEISFTYARIEWTWEPDSITAADEAISDAT